VIGGGIVGGLVKKTTATAFVMLADGTLHEQALRSAGEVQQAEKDCMRFNALARKIAGGEQS
jgi:hypothetical protein